MTNKNWDSETQWDMTLQTFFRIHSNLSLASHYKFNMDAWNWFQALQEVFKEVYTEMKDFDKMNAQRKKLLNDVNKWARSESPLKGEIGIELHEGLFQFELDLRRILNEAGLLYKRGEDYRFAMGR